MLSGWQYLAAEDRERVERGIVENRVLGGPWHLELQPTNLCNVDCFFCISKTARHGESIPWHILQKVLVSESQRDLKMLRLTGGGEPLIYPQLDALLETCGERGLILENINTNGTRLSCLAPQLVKIGLKSIVISLNEFQPARYAETMRASEADFRRVLEGIEAMIAARDAAPLEQRPIIWLQLFLWKKSAAYLAEMYARARALPVDIIFIRTIYGNYAPRLEEAERPGVEAQLREIIKQDCESKEHRLHLDLAKELNLHRFARREQEKYQPPESINFPSFRFAWPRTEYCYVGWYTTSIMARGTVYPCLQYHEMDDKQVGDLHHNSLEEIWRGARYREFRQQIRDLVTVRGLMEPSRRFQPFIERKCALCTHCQYTYNLMEPEFYERVTPQVRRSVPLRRRVAGYARNAGLFAAHRLLGRPF